MKTFIVTIAAVILLMVFPMQNIQDISKFAQNRKI